MANADGFSITNTITGNDGGTSARPFKSTFGNYAKGVRQPKVQVPEGAFNVKQGQNVMGRWMSAVETEVLNVANDLAIIMERRMKDKVYATQPWRDQTYLAVNSLYARAYGVGLEGEVLGQRRTGDFIPLIIPGERDGSYIQTVHPIHKGVVIIAQGGSDHNLWLEIAMGARYAVIRPTIEALGPQVIKEIEARLKEKGLK